MAEECRSRAAWAEQYMRERDAAVAERDELRAEVERLRAGLVIAYRDSTAAAVAVARACDECIDPSGRLLGEIRREALKEPTTPEPSKEATGP